MLVCTSLVATGRAGLPTSVVAAPQAPPLPPAITGAVEASSPAVSETLLGDVVTVYEKGNLTSTVRERVFAAARRAGAGFGTGRGFTGLLSTIRRGSTVVQRAQASGWAFPVAVTAFPRDVIRGLMGRDMAGLISGSDVVMGESSATFHGVQVGDTLTFGIGPFTSFRVALILPDADVGGTEVLMSTEQAGSIGGVNDTRVVIFQPFDRAALTAALGAQGLLNDTEVRVRTSWDAPDPDSTLSLIETKQALGEFDIDYANLTDLGWTAIDPVWKAAHLPVDRQAYPAGIQTRCHFDIQTDLRAALADVVAQYPQLINSRPTGIDVANTNQYGGCSIGLARFSRYGASVGTISRHSWGMAIDMSTVDNCQGCVPQMACEIVRIFRSHGFSWGGNYLRPDGMHFEWVGEPRDTLQYPSRYCPNLPVIGPAERPNYDARVDLFANDGISDE